MSEDMDSELKGERRKLSGGTKEKFPRDQPESNKFPTQGGKQTKEKLPRATSTPTGQEKKNTGQEPEIRHVGGLDGNRVT